MRPIDEQVLLAIVCHDADRLDLALRSGGNPNLNCNGWSPLHLAAMFGDEEQRLIASLLTWGAEVNALNKVGWSPLHLASITGAPNAVQGLLAYGADPTLKDRRGLTALDIGAAAEHQDVCRQLRASGAPCASKHKSWVGSIAMQPASMVRE